MKKKDITKFIFIVLVLFISIGFAVLTANLGINANLSFKENTFDVHFENIETLNTSTVTNPTSTITDPTSISFNGTFNKPGDYIEFSFYIVNNGTINAQLNSITTNLTTDQQNYIEYNYKYEIDNSNVNINDYLYVGQSRKIIARFTYKEDIDQFIDLESLNLSLNMKFIQPKIVNTTIWNYEYSGTEQYFIVPKSGTYKLETWGAQGGSIDNGNYNGGYGGYSVGQVNLNKNNYIYVNVGGAGESGVPSIVKELKGGYNGGGDGIINRDYSRTSASGGGGATHIALNSGLLSSFENKLDQILIVSAGGGGSYFDTDGDCFAFYGGSGGGFIGTDSVQFGDCKSNCNSFITQTGATQTRGGLGVINHFTGENSSEHCIGLFGLGGNAKSESSSSYAGGGGGLYGGGSGRWQGGGGGSGYIGNTNLTNKSMYCYNCQESSEESTKTVSTTNVSETPTSQYAKIGNGYARITYIG